MSARPHAELIHAVMREQGLSYDATATLLHVSKHTVHSWLKPGRSDAPAMAAELLCRKTKTPVPEWLKCT
jgi:DNA-binding transcriptional regulator YiaG